jgi:hypothetical protein
MYEAALAELRFSVLGEGEFDGDTYVLLGRSGRDGFSLHTIGSEPGDAGTALPCATAGPTTACSGLRPEYTGRYFGAFVLDPDGNNVEAVFRGPQPTVGAS